MIDISIENDDVSTNVVTFGLQTLLKLAPMLSPAFIKEWLPSLFPSLLQSYIYDSFEIRRATVFLLVTFKEMDEEGELEELFDQLTPSQCSVILYYVNERHNERLENDCNKVQLVGTNNEERVATSALLQSTEKEKKKTPNKKTTAKATVQPKTMCSKKNWTPNTRYNRQELLTSKLKPTQLCPTKNHVLKKKLDTKHKVQPTRATNIKTKTNTTSLPICSTKANAAKQHPLPSDRTKQQPPRLQKARATQE